MPGEQLYPPTNLALEDGVLVWTAPQASSLTLTGYHVYEGTKLVAQLPVSQTCFTPAEGASDAFTVRAVYLAGQYAQESASSNAVVLRIPEQGANQIVNLDEGSIVIPNAISEMLGKATIEFWMRNDRNTNYTHQVGPGWGTFLFHNSSNGTLSVGWDSSGSDRLNVSGVFSTLKKWNHIAIVINGNVLTLYVNGTNKGQITSSTFSGLTAFGDLQFGRTSDINQWWIGGLDEIRVWRTARTQLEIRNNMRVRIASPALQPDLLAYVPMETVQVDGETRLREYVNGKHAYFRSIGTWEVAEDESPFKGSVPTPRLSIVEESGTHLAGIPFRMTANTLLDVTDWVWSVADTSMPVLHGMSPSFTFAEAGTYNVTCTATFADSTTLSAEKEITVSQGEAPVAAFEVLCDTLPAGDRFSFINHTEGSGCTYLWSMPGAEVEELGGTNATALYPTTGVFQVTLTATNPNGQSSVTKQVVVRESAPAARFDVSSTAIMLGESVQLIDDSRYSPLSWHWELNNGCRALAVDDQSPYVTPTAPGIYDISLNVTNALGDNTLTRKRYLIVSNDDPLSCLNFTGAETIQLTCPFTETQKKLTLDWWMRPTDYQNCVSIRSSQGNLTTSVDNTGMLTLSLGSRSVTSDDGFIIRDEWHHYAVTYSSGNVKFYRDGLLFSTSSTKWPTSFPVLETITVGEGFKGQLDEVRLWGSTLDAEKVKGYCNQHIGDIGQAETDDALLLYYDFNQNGGDVADRSSGGFDAQRIGFGPDGDAWNSALGVFTLDTEALMHGDISSQYLTNYKNPYLTSSGTVNPNNSSRFLKLQMRTARSKWQDKNAIVRGNITTGAHIDTSHHSDIQFETQWSGFATPLLDYRLWQAVTLPAGRYRFSLVMGDVDDPQTSIVMACEGSTLVSEEDSLQIIAKAPMGNPTISFELDEEKEVSLGIIVNLTGQASFGIHAFKLEGVTIEPLTPEDPTGIGEVDANPNANLNLNPVKGIYDLSGRKVSDGKLSSGIYIKDGRKQVIK